MGKHEGTWVNCHLYYHQSLGIAVLRFVRPLVAKLLRSDWIDGFFFVRYGLGGPHIRLRLRARPGKARLVTEMAEAEARVFLASQPSASDLTREAILRGNKEILAADPHEFDNSVYPDNAFLVFPFRPEVERYGGSGLWEESLDFFILSSATALELLGVSGNEPRSRQLALAIRVLAGQALSFARGEEDLVSLLRYAVDLWGKEKPRAMAKAERIFVEQRSTCNQLFERELYLLSAGPNAVASVEEKLKAQLGEAARRLSWTVRTADRDVHRRIGTSQLHLTANRMGLSNAEEVYLSRILTNVATGLVASGLRPSESWGTLPVAHWVFRGGQEGSPPLRDLLPGALGRISAAVY